MSPFIASGTWEDYIFGKTVYPPGGRVDLRIQKDYQIIVLISGSLRVTVEDAIHEFGARRRHLAAARSSRNLPLFRDEDFGTHLVPGGARTLFRTREKATRGNRGRAQSAGAGASFHRRGLVSAQLGRNLSSRSHAESRPGLPASFCRRCPPRPAGDLGSDSSGAPPCTGNRCLALRSNTLVGRFGPSRRRFRHPAPLALPASRAGKPHRTDLATEGRAGHSDDSFDRPHARRNRRVLRLCQTRFIFPAR